MGKKAVNPAWFEGIRPKFDCDLLAEESSLRHDPLGLVEEPATPLRPRDLHLVHFYRGEMLLGQVLFFLTHIALRLGFSDQNFAPKE